MPSIVRADGEASGGADAATPLDGDPKVVVRARVALDADPEAVMRALVALVTTTSWDETHEVLEREQALLLTRTANFLLLLLIAKARQDKNAEDARNFERHLTLLRRARESGLSTAWAEFEAAQPDSSGVENEDELRGEPDYDADPEAVDRAIVAFVNAEPWEAKLAVLERDQTLLQSDTALLLLKGRVERAEQGQEEELTELLSLHRAILRRVRQLGVAAAWVEYDAFRQSEKRMHRDGLADSALGQMLLAWLNKPLPREGRSFLEAHPGLMAPESDIVLDGLIYQNAGQDDLEDRLRDALLLLRDVRARGLPAVSAIRDAYVNAHGGLSLDVPDWLEQMGGQLADVRRSGRTDQTAAARAALLRDAIVRAGGDGDVAPEMVAELHSQLADAITDDLLAPRAEILDQAIAAYRVALVTYTASRYPRQYAAAQINLGAAFQRRIAGVQRENLERAIAAFQEALRVTSLADFPNEYAETQDNLGNTYAERIAGERRENLERAIAAHREALRVETFEASPVEYAATQDNLAIAYRNRIAGERRENLERAIAAHREALRVRTFEAFPVEYAQTQDNLGNTYAERIAGERRENLERAIAAHREALRVYTLVGFPHNHRNSQLNLAWLTLSDLAAEARKQGDTTVLRRAYMLADAAYTAARQAQAELGWLESDEAGRANLVGERPASRDMYARHAWCLAQLGERRRAMVALEAGRAQALAEALAITGAALEGLSDEEIAMFTAARSRLNEARQAGNPEEVRAARDAFLDVRRRIRGDRELPTHPDFLPDEPDWRDVARAAAPDQGLVYLAATNFGGLGLFLPPSRDANPEAGKPVMLELSALTWELVDDWLVRPNAEGNVVGGWLLALDHNAVRLMHTWLRRVLDEQGEAVAERLLQLPLRDVADHLPPTMHTLRTALERVIAAWRAEADENSGGDEKQRETAKRQRDRLALPLGEALRTGLLDAELGWFYTEAELDYLLPEIARMVMQPLRKRLDALGLGDSDQPVALVACGRLGALPLHATEVRSAGARRSHTLAPFQETCELSYQAGARSLREAREVAEELPRLGPFLTVGDPPTGRARLPMARAEAREIAHLARQAGRGGSLALLGNTATLPALVGRTAMPGIPETPGLLREVRSKYRGAWVEIATHASADPADPTKCYMLLAHGDLLTLAFLQRERILVGVRCFIASGCVTSVGDLHVAPDELSSFAAGALQAGAASTLATQWSVSDAANYLLMLRCAKEALSHPDWRPARALREAAHWLRTATEQEVGALQDEARKGLRGDVSGEDQVSVDSAGENRRDVHDALRGATLRDVEATDEMVEEGAEDSDALRGTRATRSERPEAKHPFAHPIFWASTVAYGA